MSGNSVDPDQMLHSAASDQSLHSLLSTVFPNTESKYGSLIKMSPPEIILDQPLLGYTLFQKGEKNSLTVLPL